MREAEARRAIADLCRRMFARGLCSAADGNVSVRLDATRLLVTPSGRSDRFLEPSEMVVTDLAGRKVSGAGEPADGIGMHVLVYAERPDVHAVVHAHPPMATVLAGESPEQPVRPAPPVSDETAATIQTLVKFSDVIVVDHLGALAVGGSLEEACERLEALEQSARMPPGCPGCHSCPKASG